MSSTRFCFHADESFQDPASGEFQVVLITEGESGYVVHSLHDTIADATDTAANLNHAQGLTPADVLDVRTSSMRQHITEHGL